MPGRFEWDYNDGPEFNNALELFETRAATAIYSKRGRAALAELREALLALPRHELIEGAMCRLPADEDGEEAWPPPPPLEVVGQMRFDGTVVTERDLMGPWQVGVCAVGAYSWWKMVKTGIDPAKAFELLPRLDTQWDANGDEMFETAYVGQRAGLTYTLAWELASGNDETYAGLTPSERWQKFFDWIEGVLASPPLRRGEKPRDRLGKSYTYGY